MITRIISGIIAAAVLVALLLLPSWALAAAVLATSVIGLFEFYRAFKNKKINIDLTVSMIAAVVITGKAYGASLSSRIFPGLSDLFQKMFTSGNMDILGYILVVWLFCRVIFDGSRFRLVDLAYTLAGIVYIPFFLAYAIMIRNLDRGFEYIWLILIGSVVTDIFAYFVGVTIGTTKIVPHISPKKTVEGSVGGALGCMLVMMLYGSLILNRAGMSPIPVYHFAILGLLCGLVAQIGDWAASAIKRYTGIKDFGSLIPGHGGIMDRADSVLFVAPLVYIYLSLFILN